VQPFDLLRYVPADRQTRDLVHRFYQEQYQINGGKMDQFVAWSDAAGLVISYYLTLRGNSAKGVSCPV
jgi:phospholipase C